MEPASRTYRLTTADHLAYHTGLAIDEPPASIQNQFVPTAIMPTANQDHPVGLTLSFGKEVLPEIHGPPTQQVR